MSDDARTDQIETTASVTEPGSRFTLLRGDRDRLATQLAIGVIALGFVLMGAAWFGASGKNFVQQQFPYLLSGGLPGLALVFLGGGILFVRDIRRERDALEANVNRLASMLEELLAERRGTLRTGPMRGSDDAPSRNGSVVLGRTVFHAPDCRLVQGKDDLERVPRDAAVAEGLAPCRTCEP